MMNDTEVQEALDHLAKRIPDLKRHLVHYLQERLPYVVQRRTNHETGEWENLGAIIVGRSKAFEMMNQLKKEIQTLEGDHDWRVLPKNEADKLMEGIKIGLAIPSEDDDARRKRPLMHMPEHL